MFVVLIPFPWKRLHTFMGGAGHLKDIDNSLIHCVKGKRPRYARDKGNKKKATRDEGLKCYSPFNFGGPFPLLLRQ